MESVGYTLGPLLFAECKSFSTAPPSIICKYCQYNEETKSCMLPMIKKEETEDVHLTVEFSGVGPFSVVWHHSGNVLECSNNTADKTQCSVKRFSNSTYGYEVKYILILQLQYKSMGEGQTRPIYLLTSNSYLLSTGNSIVCA